MHAYFICGILCVMHKDFYASGFLFHPRSQQILLQQQNSADTESVWDLFGDKRLDKETEEETFRRAIYSNLRLKLKPRAIKPVYSYYREDKNKNNYICYAKVEKLEKFQNKKNLFAWFTFKQIQKLNVSEQTRQDILVGQRVIYSSVRKRLGLRTIG